MFNIIKNMRFNFSRELDTTELIKGIFTLVGVLIIFFTITLALRDVEIKKLQLSLAQELPKLIPAFRNNYTNQISEDGRHIEVRAILRNQSSFSAYLYNPTLQILDKNDVHILDAIVKSNISQISGLLSPMSEYKVSYKITLGEQFILDGHKIRILFKVEMPDSLKVIYQDLFENIPDANWGKVEEAWTIDYIYKEPVYVNNPIWKNWWTNPR
ncbi:MAG: hypothetical protein MJK12_18075 [Colwellia sp.]|nr:hypothetical protein [Colwellia sp.]